MAILFGLVSSAGFLWFQLAIFVWQAIRPAAILRVPWALFSTAVYKILGGQEFSSDYFVSLSTDYNDTSDVNEFWEKNKSKIDEFTIDGSSSTCFIYKNSHYICDNQKDDQVRLLIAAELNNVAIAKEFKTITAYVDLWTVCSADEAIRMCLPSKRFRLSFRRRVLFCLIEHMSLIPDTYWLSRMLSGIPLYLNAKGKDELSSLLTFALIILDFTYNIWVPLLEKSYLMFVRCVQLILSSLPLHLRTALFYLLRNFDNKYMPCSISDLKVKVRKTDVFYTFDNVALNCPVQRISKVNFDEVDIYSRDTFEFHLIAFKAQISVLCRGNNFLRIDLRLPDVLFNLIKLKYPMSELKFKTYVGCLRLLEADKIGSARIVDQDIIKSMHLFGFEECCNIFWASDVSVYKVDVGEPHRFLIA